MKSENDLKITGVVSSDVTPNRTNRYVKFRLSHYFAHGVEPLHLDCILMFGNQTVLPKQGDRVRMRAYLRTRRGMIEAVVKTLNLTEE